MSMGARPPTKMAARVQSHIDRRNGFFLAVPAPNWLSWTDTRKPAVFLATGSIPVGTAGDQQHRVATALYEDLAQIVAMCITTKSALAAELGITRGRVSQRVAAGLPVRSDGRLNREEAIRWVARKHYRRFGGDDGARRARQLVRDGFADEDLRHLRVDDIFFGQRLL